MLSDRSKRMRATGIGASEVAAICGIDEHRSPMDVFLEKLGLKSVQETDAMESGHELEAPIGRMYCRRTGARLHSGGGTLRHPKYPWALATIDRRATPGPPSIVELKNVGAFMTRGWNGTPPASKVMQVTWQMFVAQQRAAHIAALLGGTAFQIYYVDFDEELCDMAFEVVRDFWVDHVDPAIRARDAGDPGWARFAEGIVETPGDALALVGAIYPENDGRMLPATDAARALHRELGDIEAQQKALKTKREMAEAQAKALIGKADGIDGCFTWKLDSVGKTSWADVAKAMNPSQELIDTHTGPPARRFLRKGK